MIIDYEFCSYNYRAFDIANHLCEWMFDYNHKAYPFYHFEKDKFPSKERQVQLSFQRNSTFFTFPLIIEGTTEKVLKFKMPLKSVYNRNMYF